MFGFAQVIRFINFTAFLPNSDRSTLPPILFSFDDKYFFTI